MQSASTAERRLIVCGVRGLCRRNRITLALRPPERAAISPKSRSKVRTTRSSGDRLGEHVEIGGTLEALVAEMLCVVALAAQPVDHAEADAHVREELHEALTGMDFLLGQPGGVFDGLLDVFTFEIGIVGKDLFERRAVRDLPDDDRDGDPHSADGDPASEDLRVKRDPVERSRL